MDVPFELLLLLIAIFSIASFGIFALGLLIGLLISEWRHQTRPQSTLLPASRSDYLRPSARIERSVSRPVSLSSESPKGSRPSSPQTTPLSPVQAPELSAPRPRRPRQTQQYNMCGIDVDLETAIYLNSLCKSSSRSSSQKSSSQKPARAQPSPLPSLIPSLLPSSLSSESRYKKILKEGSWRQTRQQESGIEVNAIGSMPIPGSKGSTPVPAPAPEVKIPALFGRIEKALITFLNEAEVKGQLVTAEVILSVYIRELVNIVDKLESQQAETLRTETLKVDALKVVNPDVCKGHRRLNREFGWLKGQYDALDIKVQLQEKAILTVIDKVENMLERMSNPWR